MAGQIPPESSTRKRLQLDWRINRSSEDLAARRRKKIARITIHSGFPPGSSDALLNLCGFFRPFCG
jgi:hypothetical protein